MRTTLPLTLAVAVMAAGCSSAPKLPQASGAFQPANDSATIEALRLQAEMQNARRELEFARRSADARTMLMQPVGVPLFQPASMRATPRATPVQAAAAGANVIFTIHFASGATRPAPAPDAMKALTDAARAAPLVAIRGRTDAPAFNAVNDRMARLRAEETRAMLIRAGVEPRRIRVTWQAAGDTVASNDTASGRDLNRRAEVEVYAADPTSAETAPPAAAAAVARGML